MPIQAIKIVLGLAGVMAVRYGLKAVFPGTAFWNMLRYAMVAVWALSLIHIFQEKKIAWQPISPNINSYHIHFCRTLGMSWKLHLVSNRAAAINRSAYRRNANDLMQSPILSSILACQRTRGNLALLGCLSSCLLYTSRCV